jgi:SAM-dependent methyltransferase
VPEPRAENPLHAEHFRRIDESPDSLFYGEPRFVTHIDDGAIAALTECYREVLPAGGRILDLMSSWVSHLPNDVTYAGVTGLGMNADELQENPQLTDWVVHDLNDNLVLPFGDATFDAATVAVSVQYLTQPAAVFRDVARVLMAGAPFVVSFSNRCFPTKAVAAWHLLDDRGHGELVGLYFRLSGAFDTPQALVLRPPGQGSDPLYAVVAHVLPVEDWRKVPPLSQP